MVTVDLMLLAVCGGHRCWHACETASLPRATTSCSFENFGVSGERGEDEAGKVT